MIKFRIFSDVHFAKGLIKTGDERYCDFSIYKLRECIKTFNNSGVDFAINLADIIHSAKDNEIDSNNIDEISKVLSSFNGDIYSLIGNHDIESMDKNEFLLKLSSKSSHPYFSIDRENWHLVFLDPNYREDEIEYDTGNYDWTDSKLPLTQKDWLIADLSVCTRKNVLVLSHQNIDDKTIDDKPDPHIIKNAAVIRDILEKCNKKVVVFQGHYHRGGHRIVNGIHYITLKAMCVGKTMDDNAYMIVNLLDDGKATISGFGRQESEKFQI